MSRLSDYLGKLRLEQGLRICDLAMRCGYPDSDRGRSRGGGRISGFERTGSIGPDLLKKMIAALNADLATAVALARQDYEEYTAGWEAWVNEPVEPQLLLRGPCVHRRVPIPPGFTAEELIQYASDLAQHKRNMVCLVLSRRTSIVFQSDGSVGHVAEARPGHLVQPYISLGGKKFAAYVTGGRLKVCPVDQPPQPSPGPNIKEE